MGRCSCLRQCTVSLPVSGSNFEDLGPPDKLMGSGEHRAAGPILQWRRLKWVEIYPGHPRVGEAQGHRHQSILVIGTNPREELIVDVCKYM